MSTVERTSPTPPDTQTTPDPQTTPDSADPTAQERPSAAPGRRVRVRTVVAGTVAVAVAGAATVAALGVFGGDAGGTPAASQLPPATTEVALTTLVRTETFDGSLGYGEATTVSAVAGDGQGGAGAGIITWSPAIGETIARGEPVYSVNAEPVVLMYGDMPFFRQLQEGNRGADVRQLEENLSELGYSGFTVDRRFTWATAEAVAQWQDDVGLAETGTFDPSQAVVAPGAIRIAEPLAPLGASANGAVLSYTATDRMVTVEMEVADQRYVAEEMPVTVTLPDGGTVDGTIDSVGTVATGGDADDPQSSEPTTIEVVVTVDDPEALGDWDTAPVQVAVEVERREDVLAVPVGALVALAEGGYGLQVVDGDQTSYLPVETGLFADGLVEVSGDGLAEGMLVGVPA